MFFCFCNCIGELAEAPGAPAALGNDPSLNTYCDFIAIQIFPVDAKFSVIYLINCGIVSYLMAQI